MKMFINLNLAGLLLVNFSSIFAMGFYEAGVPYADIDPSASAVWTVGAIQAEDVYQQYGITHRPITWHSLDADTAEQMRETFSGKIQGVPLNNRLELLAKVVADISCAKPAHNEKLHQQKVLKDFFQACLPGDLVRNIDKEKIKDVERTKSLSFLRYVFETLQHENEQQELPVSVRGNIVQLQQRIEALENNKDYSIQGEANALPVHKTHSGSSSPQAIFAAASAVMGASPILACSLDNHRSYDPTDSVLITEQARGALNMHKFSEVAVRSLSDEQQKLLEIIKMISAVQSLPEFEEASFTQTALGNSLLERYNRLNCINQELEAYQLERNTIQTLVSDAKRELGSRKQERDEALKNVTAQISAITSERNRLQELILRATEQKQAIEQQLAELESVRAKIQAAQKRVEEGLAVTQGFALNQQP